MATKNYSLYLDDGENPPYRWLSVFTNSKGDAEQIAKVLSAYYKRYVWIVKKGTRVISKYDHGRKERK